jgi:hypothetical protein
VEDVWLPLLQWAQSLQTLQHTAESKVGENHVDMPAAPTTAVVMPSPGADGTEEVTLRCHAVPLLPNSKRMSSIFPGKTALGDLKEGRSNTDSISLGTETRPAV